MRTRRILYITIISGALAVFAALWRYRKLLFMGRDLQSSDRTIPDFDVYQGLSEEEATAHLSGSARLERSTSARQVRRQIWRTSTFSIFNMGMLGLAIAQTLLGDPLSALLTVGVLILNIVLTAGQQLYATSQVEKLLDQEKPMAAAIRDGRIRSLPGEEIVIDDVLVTGPGDEFLASGVLLGGSPVVLAAASEEDESRTRQLTSGDPIVAGTFCVKGRAVYRATETAFQGEHENWSPVQEKEDWTPLQRIMARILRVLLGLIVFFLALLVVDMANFPLLGTIFEADYRETASVFFSIAPSSLYFMIVVTYALGSVRLSDLGALVRDSRAVESLAQISVLCLSKTGVLTGAKVTFEMPGETFGHAPLAETRVLQILGDLAFSMPADNIYFQALRATFKGEQRAISEEAPHLAAYGWRAATFAEPDLLGTYVIGEPSILAPFLMSPTIPDEEDPDPFDSQTNLRSQFQNRLGQFTSIIRREKPEPQVSEGIPHPEIESGGQTGESIPARIEEGGGLGGAYRQLRQRLSRRDPAVEEAAESEEHRPPELLFAYYPDPQPLHNPNGALELRNDLRPLGTLRFREQLRPETQEALQSFVDSGVQLRILSSDTPDRVIKTAVELGLAEPGLESPSVVSGFDLDQLPSPQFQDVTSYAPVFANLSSSQKARIIRQLQDQGERVAMVGDSVDDMGAMGAANLSLTLHSSSQATLGAADIVLMEDSFVAMPAVLGQGQRIVNGMLDILKINLAQIGYVLLLIVAMIIAGRRIFYYHPTQGGIVAFFTVVVPSLGLTFFASKGAVPRQYMRSRMVHFVVPAALTMTAAALIISRIFDQGVNEITYSQLAVTYGLIVMGLLLVIFVQPPSRFWVGGDVLSTDRRTTYMAFILHAVFLIAAYLPITQEIFRLSTLENVKDYAVVIMVAVVWLFLIRTIWRAPWLRRYTGIVFKRLARE